MSENTVRVRVDRGEYRHEREHYTRGDELEVPEKTLEKHPNSLTRIEDGEEAEAETEPEPEPETSDSTDGNDAGDDEGGSEDIEVDPHPTEVTIDELEERIADVEDVALLEAIREEEATSKERTGALDALDSRIAAVEEDGV